MKRVPRALAGRDIRTLPLRPVEAFVLSRIDAATDEHDISLLTGLSEPDVEASLNRLFDLGVIDFVRGERGSAVGLPPDTRAAVQAPASRSATEMGRSRPSSTSPSTRRLYDPAELDEDIELDLERKRRVLDLFHRLNELSHYEILRVERTAEKKRIKSAYYEIAPEFHTDKYFGKRLGSFKAKIEAIFSRITVAHDVLTHKERRAEYDRQLPPSESERSIASSIPDANIAVTVSEPPSPSPPPESSRYRSSPPDPDADVLSERSRREALAKKLSAGYRRASSPSVRATPDDPNAASDADQRRAQIERAERSLRQGRDEAGEGRWPEAAQSFAEACRVLSTNADAHERAAFAVLRAGASPAKAIELARRSVEIAPSVPEYRLTLARAYFAEGMERRARAELDQAAALSRGDAGIKRCIEEIIEQAQRRGKVG